MRIVSLVPSWTETLFASEAKVVGRTRYCIHPHGSVKTAQIVGGTKNLQIEKIKQLNPDLIVLDKEENTREMAEELSDFPQWISHIRSIQDMPEALNGLLQATQLPELENMAMDWSRLLSAKAQSFDFKNLPGLMKWVKQPSVTPKRILYLIWHNPWMGINSNTFIGSVFDWLGAGHMLPSFDKQYPEIDIRDFTDPETIILASSEPFPFAQKEEVFKGLENPVAIVDGEVFSWFGIRSYRALEKLKDNAST